MEIKPCPYCKNTKIEWYNDNGTNFMLRCERCVCQSPTLNSKEEVILEWNRVAGIVFETERIKRIFELE